MTSSWRSRLKEMSKSWCSSKRHRPSQWYPVLTVATYVRYVLAANKDTESMEPALLKLIHRLDPLESLTKHRQCVGSAQMKAHQVKSPFPHKILRRTQVIFWCFRITNQPTKRPSLSLSYFIKACAGKESNHPFMPTTRGIFHAGN